MVVDTPPPALLNKIVELGVGCGGDITETRVNSV